jgi:hypothetical protein
VRKAVSQNGYFEGKWKRYQNTIVYLAFPDFPSLVRHFIASRRGLYQPSDAISAPFAVSAWAAGKATKTTLDRCRELR